MSNTDYHYGLDADLAAKRAANYDKNLENDCRAWIESTTGTPFPSGDFGEVLKDGLILCSLANALKPGSTKPQKSKAPFVQMENINSYLNFCKGLGVVSTDLFQTVDLYNASNLNQVIQNIQAVKRLTSGGKPSSVPVKSQPAPAAAPQPTASSNFCSKCGTKSAGGAFCGSCGNKL
eukprot:gene5213-6491_t